VLPMIVEVRQNSQLPYASLERGYSSRREVSVMQG
jgi:hypothetical protein